MTLRSIAPRGMLARLTFDAALGALVGVGLAAHVFALAWSTGGAHKLWWGLDTGFGTLIIVASLFGGVTYCSLGYVWREARARVTPWLAVAVALWVTAEWSLTLGPAAQRWSDPRYMIATYTVFAAIPLLFVAVVAFIDWRINRSEQAEPEKSNG